MGNIESHAREIFRRQASMSVRDIMDVIERAIAESQAPLPWQHIPSQYKQNRWAFEYDERKSTFFVHSGGHRICDAEDSGVASAICAAFNSGFVKG